MLNRTRIVLGAAQGHGEDSLLFSVGATTIAPRWFKTKKTPPGAVGAVIAAPGDVGERHSLS